MSRTTFSGPVASDNGFISVAATSGKLLTIKAPAALTSDTTLTFPNGAGSNGQYLKTDGTGALSWAAGDGSGTVTSVAGAGSVNGLTLTGTVTTSGSLTLGGTLDLSSPPAIGGTAAAAGTFTNLTANDKIIGAVQSLSGPGAINLTDPITTITTTGGDAFTLANGVAGQIKYVVMIVDGGDATITPTTLLGGTTIKLDAVGQGVTLVYTASGWVVASNNGASVT
jgi:hypothetical protein